MPTPADPSQLPAGLPVPLDDGAANHLVGALVPDVSLRSTDGRLESLSRLGKARTIVYAYPRTGRPGEPELTSDWDLIPGARGCTPEACAFRDHHDDLKAAGARVFGLSTQSTAHQQELVARLQLPFPVLSDEDLALTRAMRLPTFRAAGQTLLRRLTLVILDGRVEHVWYPVFPPDQHAERVLEWLRLENA